MIPTALTIPLGVLSWNLPPTVHYEAGTAIPLELWVGNPTWLPREYSLHLRVTQDSKVVEERTITVDDETSFRVMGNGQRYFYGEETVSVTDAVLSLSLYDVATEDYVASVSTQLYSGFLAPSFPWQLMFVGLGGLVMVGLTAAVVTSIVKEKK